MALLPTSATLLLVLVATMAMSFRLQNDFIQNKSQSETPHLSKPPVLYKAIVYLDGRPTEVLEDNLGYPDLKIQTGDKMPKPWPFVGTLAYVSPTNLKDVSAPAVNLSKINFLTARSHGTTTPASIMK